MSGETLPTRIIVRHRLGGWLPQDHELLRAWVDKKIAYVTHPSRAGRAFSPVIQEFQTLIETDPQVWMGFHQMFEQVPTKPPYDNDPTGEPQVRDYMTMLALFDQIITEAPEYESSDQGLIGFPINAILDWPMGTPGGLTAFLNPAINAQFKKMFDVWKDFLDSSASCYVLTTNTNGWFGPDASAAMPDFVDLFICDPALPYYGFTSWDKFFTRLFRDGKRPVILPDDDTVINAACESAVYKIAYNVKALDEFYLKGEPYSLNHMLDNHEFAPTFVGGTVYQAFLSALKYHRWHSPVNGTVKKVVPVQGTYYAEFPYMGFTNPDGPDPEAPNSSQAFITALATRVLIFIEADNPAIGLMCFIAVGMAEVSTCESTVAEGTVVKKGDQLGMFHFGGSTYCLVFRPGVNVTFLPEQLIYPPPDVNINTPIATVATA